MFQRPLPPTFTWMPILIAIGCAGPAKHASHSPTPQKAEPPRFFVALRADAPLYLAPREDAAVIYLQPRALESGPTADSIRLRLIEDHGDFLEVRARTAHELSHCAPEIRGLRAYNIPMFVRRDALRTVITRTVLHEFNDGTSVTLYPGTPVEEPRKGDGWRRILGRTASFHAPVPPDAVGSVYRARHRQRGGKARDAWIEAKDELRFGPGEQVLFKRSATALTRVFDIRQTANGQLVTWQHECFAVRGRTAGEARALGRHELGHATLPPDGSQSLIVNPGRPVLWDDGRIAGVSSGQCIDPRSITKVSNRLCYTHHHLRVSSANGRPRALRVCFNPRDVTSGECSYNIKTLLAGH